MLAQVVMHNNVTKQYCQDATPNKALEDALLIMSKVCKPLETYLFFLTTVM